MNSRLTTLSVAILGIVLAAPAMGQQAPAIGAQSAAVSGAALSAPAPRPATITGTVSDSNNGIIPGAQVVLSGPTSEDNQTATANDNGGFSFENLKPGVPYHVTISAKGFVTWTSPAIVLNSGQYMILSGANLAIAGGSTSITVSAASSDIELATQQVQMEEHQRVLGVVPNFYVVYDHNAAPLTAKLKFKLAWKAETDPVTFLGAGFVAGLDQEGATPNYGEGAGGYGQRLGALYANGFTDIMFGGAILPSLLHQDPRYFYQGEGTTRSRLLHALSNPFIAKGDNGRWQPNYSSVGGDLISGAISNAYYPESNRGASLVFVNAGITTGGRMVNGVIQEFLLRRFTPGVGNRAE
ncbi:MAG TPA: carboxypeptidase-like regulatory domain-containing protein [Terracidiphilus sp.]|nr:carboxypeptidase-like regulatory domain-containing protein [Terracidiphilus sp.]